MSFYQNRLEKWQKQSLKDSVEKTFLCKCLQKARECVNIIVYADMAELADAQDLGSCSKRVQVRPLLSAPKQNLGENMKIIEAKNDNFLIGDKQMVVVVSEQYDKAMIILYDKETETGLSFIRVGRTDEEHIQKFVQKFAGEEIEEVVMAKPNAFGECYLRAQGEDYGEWMLCVKEGEMGFGIDWQRVQTLSHKPLEENGDAREL